MIQEKLHFYNCEATFDLVDFGGALYHPNYLILCDRARASALEISGYPVPELWKDGLCLALVDNNSQYKKPILFGQKVTVITKIINFSGMRLVVQQSIHNQILNEKSAGYCDPSQIDLSQVQTYFDTNITLACLALNSFKPSRFPPKLIEVLHLARR